MGGDSAGRCFGLIRIVGGRERPLSPRRLPSLSTSAVLVALCQLSFAFSHRFSLLIPEGGPPVVYFVGCYCGDHEGLPFTWSLSVARAFQTIRARQRTIDLRAALLVSLPHMADGFHFVCYAPFWRSPFRGRRPLLPSGQLLFLARIGLFREGSHVFQRSLLFFFLYLRQARPAHSFFALSISPPLAPPPTKKHYEPCCLLSPRRLS